MIDRIPAAARLLVACDFDGTLAPIVANPDEASALPGSVEALRRLAGSPNTQVAIVSGRRRSELVERFGEKAFMLIGEHGSDTGNPAMAAETIPGADSLDRARRLVDAAAASTPGAHSEHKDQSVVFHYRTAPDAEATVAHIRQQAGDLDGVKVIDGKKALELSAATTDKGAAIDHIRHELGADVVLFVGDDVTDESVFEVLGPDDIGIKVGPGETAAAYRVADPEAVTRILEQLARTRSGA